ncbi:uncharacterized protein TRIADDRAFT_57804 [Trichoplax adhaerens]|uniref:CCHC-type domain-containing protein n=1 Tax=Trichoplax adhaerens TaxID=10228 RepID=B3S1E8_TRIAD|nr:hypothetical protein TRIADDRAFT_57804 [Trichoplax adhaerens]EDV22995.1 hypothetical protein TRIADDRAFT_57804 [Trichoplax adhaerens]|eukprot:XP_002113905.1 hypothetical protein TRIADDRAFT_57804 [Trichoplax adhaerens]
METKVEDIENVPTNVVESSGRSDMVHSIKLHDQMVLVKVISKDQFPDATWVDLRLLENHKLASIVDTKMNDQEDEDGKQSTDQSQRQLVCLRCEQVLENCTLSAFQTHCWNKIKALRNGYLQNEIRWFVKHISDEHYRKLDIFTEVTAEQSGLSAFSLKQRAKIVTELQEIVTEFCDRDSLIVEIKKILEDNAVLIVDVEIWLLFIKSTMQDTLIATYCKIDSRTRQLGVVLRKWARVCGIDRPNEGGLHPGALIIMLIYYLQRCTPPVLPVLHELASDDQSKNFNYEIDGVPFIYFNDIDTLDDIWQSDNEKSIGQLWLGFFTFYSLDYGISRNVVCITSKSTITRRMRKWEANSFAIESPFGNRHNCGKTVTTRQVIECPKQFEWLSDSSKITDTFQLEKIFVSGTHEMPLRCPSCDGNHRKDNCPESISTLNPLPEMNIDYLRAIDEFCYYVKDYYAMSAEEKQFREEILHRVTKAMQAIFPEATLHLFGSSKNGFGTKQSDVDMCMMIPDDSLNCLDEKLRGQEAIRRIAKQLRKKSRDFAKVQDISRATVPIVKFYDVRRYVNPTCSLNRKLSCDISYQNALAVHNTNLLASYGSLDDRIPILVLVLKLIAKACDIGDASRGSLSSYAHTLMMIYFLQHCDPPVLPVLQELHDGDKPEQTVENWNVWFQEDRETIRKWSGFGKNKESVGSLLLKFYRYYTETFNFTTDVIAIRQFDPMTKLNKGWYTKFIAIEVNSYIKSVLRNCRTIFGTPQPIQHHFMDHFLNLSKLTNGKKSPDQNRCFNCGFIGHRRKDCPKSRNFREQTQGLPAHRDNSPKMLAQAFNVLKINENGKPKQGDAKFSQANSLWQQQNVQTGPVAMPNVQWQHNPKIPVYMEMPILLNNGGVMNTISKMPYYPYAPFNMHQHTLNANNAYQLNPYSNFKNYHVVSPTNVSSNETTVNDNMSDYECKSSIPEKLEAHGSVESYTETELDSKPSTSNQQNQSIQKESNSRGQQQYDEHKHRRYPPIFHHTTHEMPPNDVENLSTIKKSTDLTWQQGRLIDEIGRSRKKNRIRKPKAN